MADHSCIFSGHALLAASDIYSLAQETVCSAGPVPTNIYRLHAKAGCTLQTAAATATVGNSMATASAAMASVGQAANPAKMQQTMQQFAKENAKMDMASEMMGDAVDDALDDDEVEDETDDLMNQVNASFLSTLTVLFNLPHVNTMEHGFPLLLPLSPNTLCSSCWSACRDTALLLIAQVLLN